MGWTIVPTTENSLLWSRPSKRMGVMGLGITPTFVAQKLKEMHAAGACAQGTATSGTATLLTIGKPKPDSPSKSSSSSGSVSWCAKIRMIIC